MLAAPLEDFGSEFGLEVPATMLVFESPDLVEAFYAGERRAGNGRNHPEAPLCVLALEVRSQLDSVRRYLRLLSAHGDGRHDYRLEVRQIALADHLSLEDILETDDGFAWRGSEEVERSARPAGAPVDLGLSQGRLRLLRREDVLLPRRAGDLALHPDDAAAAALASTAVGPG